jgi:hypothetical protein
MPLQCDIVECVEWPELVRSILPKRPKGRAPELEGLTVNSRTDASNSKTWKFICGLKSKLKQVAAEKSPARRSA